MNFINLLIEHKYNEAKEIIYAQLNEISSKKLEEIKRTVAADIYEEVEIVDEANVQTIGRISKVRRRIRRNKQGRIVLQRNIRKSAIKGFRISGNTVKRISAISRIKKSRKLKKYWNTKGRAKLTRTLLRRKMSIRRRTIIYKHCIRNCSVC
jgi:hypothetical protein